MLRTYSLMLAFEDFLMWISKLSSQIGCFVWLYSLLMSLLIFCLKATLLSFNFSTIWGTSWSRLMWGVCKIYSNIFSATKATLKLGSPRSLMRIGTKDFMMTSWSKSSFEIWNFVCNYSTASSRAFQSLSFFRSSTSFLPTTCSIFSCLLGAGGFIFVIGGNITLVSLGKDSGFLTYLKFRECWSSLWGRTAIVDSIFFNEFLCSDRLFRWETIYSWPSWILRGATLWISIFC